MISVRVFTANARRRINHKETAVIARSVLRGENCNEAEVNIVFINDRKMIGLNRKYLKHNYTTDVLSFSLGERPGITEGEVYVNTDQARRQGREYGVRLKEEISRLVIHGLLHLCGYRDDTVRLKSRMAGKENLYLSKL